MCTSVPCVYTLSSVCLAACFGEIKMFNNGDTGCRKVGAVVVVVCVLGRRQNGFIVFNATQVIEHSGTRNQLTNWSVTGQLTKVGDHLVYSGIMFPGPVKLMMSPTTSAPSAIRQCSLLHSLF